MLRKQIFISYSHKDKEWRDELNLYLKPYLLDGDGSISSWSDEQITPGSQWFEEIESALTHTKVAVLLVSPDFIASDFIRKYELGPLLKEAKARGIKILWVHVRDCGYKQTALKDYQAVIDPDKPLDQMTLPQRGSAWVKICERIEKAVSAPDPPPRPPVPLPPDPHPRPPKTLMIVGIIVLLIVASVFIWQRIKPSHHNPTPNPASPSPVILTPTQSPSPPPGDRIITAGAPVKGSIVTDQDRYFFKFQASSTKTRVILRKLSKSGFQAAVDVYDHNEKGVAEEHQGVSLLSGIYPQNQPITLSFESHPGELYSIVVTALDPNARGDYELTVREE